MTTTAIGTGDLLAQVVADRRAADRAEADLLLHVAAFADAHPVWGDVVPADWGTGDRCFHLEATGPDAGPDAGADAGEVGRVAGEGTPQVAEYAIVELAAALGVSFRTGLGLVAETLELRHRLPRTWALIQAGGVSAWKARAAARLTTQLQPATVAFVDGQLVIAPRRGQLTPAGSPPWSRRPW